MTADVLRGEEPHDPEAGLDGVVRDAEDRDGVLPKRAHGEAHRRRVEGHVEHRGGLHAARGAQLALVLLAESGGEPLRRLQGRAFYFDHPTRGMVGTNVQVNSRLVSAHSPGPLALTAMSMSFELPNAETLRRCTVGSPKVTVAVPMAAPARDARIVAVAPSWFSVTLWSMVLPSSLGVPLRGSRKRSVCGSKADS